MAMSTEINTPEQIALNNFPNAKPEQVRVLSFIVEANRRGERNLDSYLNDPRLKDFNREGLQAFAKNAR